MQWVSDLIGYDTSTSYGSPSYYTQVMFSSCLGDHTLNSAVSGAGDKFFYSVTGSASKVCLKLVNATSTDQPVTITLNGLGAASRTARVTTLHGNTIWATNTVKDPKRIVPLNSTLNIKGERVPYVAPAYSIQVVEIDLR
jgi:alpha-N-arabinofuranosidase